MRAFGVLTALIGSLFNDITNFAFLSMTSVLSLLVGRACLACLSGYLDWFPGFFAVSDSLAQRLCEG